MRKSSRAYPFHPVKIAGAAVLGVAAALTLALGGRNNSTPSSSTTPSTSSTLTTPPTVLAPVLEAPTSPPSAGDFVLNGTGTPGSEVQILRDGVVLGKTQVSDTGNFDYTVTLKAGPTVLSAAALDSSGVSAAKSAPLVLEVSAASSTPDSSTPDSSTTTPTLPTPDTSAPTTPAPTFAILSPTDGSSVSEGPLTLSGVAKPDSSVDVFDGDTQAGTVKSDGMGKWSLELTPKGAGDHAFEIRGGGKTSRISLTLRPKGLAAGTLVPCPCNLRISTIPSSAVVTVFQGARELERQRGPSTFFVGYKEGNYRYNVYVKGYKSLDKSFSLPKNRNISVYLDKNLP